MYQIGDWVQFRYDDIDFYGEIVPFAGHREHDYSLDSYLVQLKGFVDPALSPDELRYHGWSSHTAGPLGARYLWINHGFDSLAYYRRPLPPRPVSPVFYTLKEAT